MHKWWSGRCGPGWKPKHAALQNIRLGNACFKVIVQLDFVKKSGGPVVASSITYAGYVGVLTGIRKGMTMSLNFRPTHDASTIFTNIRFYLNHLLAILGWRPSIFSIFRQCHLPTSESGRRLGKDLESIERAMPSLKTTAAYLIFSNGQRTITMEKDYQTADIYSSTDFIVATNHDVSEEGESEAENQESMGNAKSQVQQATGMEVLVEESIDRKACATRFYASAKKKNSKSKNPSLSDYSNVFVMKDQVIEWMNKYPVMNEETHFAIVMDPTRGKVVWARMFP